MKLKKSKIKPVFKDQRGKIYDLVKDQVQHAGLVTFNTGALRGKHYHKLSKQYNYLLKGRVKLVLKDMRDKNSQPQTLILEEEDLILIPANWYHSLEALENSTLLFFTSGGRHGSKDYEKDTYREEI